MADAPTRRRFNSARIFFVGFFLVVLAVGILATIDGATHGKPIPLVIGCAGLVLSAFYFRTLLKILRFRTTDLP